MRRRIRLRSQLAKYVLYKLVKPPATPCGLRRRLMQPGEAAALQVDQRAEDQSDDDGMNPVFMQDGNLGHEGADIDQQEQEGGKRRNPGDEHADAADQFQCAGENPKPLTKADLVEFGDHHRLARQLHEAGKEEEAGHQRTQHP